MIDKLMRVISGQQTFFIFTKCGKIHWFIFRIHVNMFFHSVNDMFSSDFSIKIDMWIISNDSYIDMHQVKNASEYTVKPRV